MELNSGVIRLLPQTGHRVALTGSSYTGAPSSVRHFFELQEKSRRGPAPIGSGSAMPQLAEQLLVLECLHVLLQLPKLLQRPLARKFEARRRRSHPEGYLLA